MKKKLTSSAIIPFFNAGKFIDETLNSLRAQTRKFDEIIIVNDGSSDELSLEKLKILRKDKNLIVVDQENQGVVQALTNGMKLAKSDIVFEIDADDVLLSEYVEKFMDVFEKNSEAKGVTCGYKAFFDGKDYRNDKNFHEFYMPLGYRAPDMFFYNCVGGQNSAFRKKQAENVNYYLDFGGAQDWGIWLKFATKKYKQVVIDEYLYLYRVHKNGFSQRIERDHDFDEALRKMMGLFYGNNENKYSKQEYLEKKQAFFELRKERIKKRNKTVKSNLNLRKISQLSTQAIYNAKREGLITTIKRAKNYLIHGKGFK